VHGTTVIGDGRYEGPEQEGDGLVTDQAGVALVIRTADCLPIHATDRNRIACFHAGWRGTEAGIVGELARFFKTAHTHVAIGPAISAANYEVDVDLYGTWRAREPELEHWLHPSAHAPRGSSRRLFNLKGLVRAQLISIGLTDERLTLIPVCTYDSQLPSYRRQRDTTDRIYNYIYKTE
jgi:hypothetical protein